MLLEQGKENFQENFQQEQCMKDRDGIKKVVFVGDRLYLVAE